MTTTRTLAEILSDVEDNIREIIAEDYRHGANDYAYVRVWPDGSVTSGRAPSWECPESEYFGREPHPITVWAESGFREAAGPQDGIFECEEVEGDAEDSDEMFVSDGKRYRLTTDMVEQIDLADTMREVENRLSEHDWIPKE